MKISKSKAVALFVALGLKNADKWNDARMATKLSKVSEMVDDDVKLEDDEAATLAEVTAANEAGEEFEVVDDDPAPEAVADPVVADPVVDESEPGEEPVAKPKKEKKAKQPKEPKVKKEKTQRRTVHFVCGELIAKHGIGTGITKELVKELTDEVGKEDQMARFAIDAKTGWHAIAGYVGFEGDAVGVNTKMATRPNAAGKIYKEKGLDCKVSELIAVLNERYGKANDTQSTYTLRNSLGAIKGFLAANSKEESQTTSD